MARWAAVKAVNADGYITELQFDGLSSDQTLVLPENLAKLQHVTKINLSAMTKIPSFLARMPRLKELDLFHCTHSGSQALIDQLKTAGVTVYGG